MVPPTRGNVATVAKPSLALTRIGATRESSAMSVVVPLGNAEAAPAGKPERVGVLLVNLGTPDTCDARGVRVYLKEFLSDPRVIENQGLVWQAILNGIILRVRPRAEGARLPEDLEYREERVAAEDHHARAGRKARRRRSPITSMSWSTGRCATAIRRSARASMR